MDIIPPTFCIGGPPNMGYLIAGLAILLIAALAYWELKISEGAHLGRTVVVLLYDLAARRYEGIKQFDPDWERHFLGKPLAATIGTLADARVLDVGAGTGRVGRAFLPAAYADVHLTNLEPAALMIEQGRHLLLDRRAAWVQGWGDALPFADNFFDGVVCLEVLEFTPHPAATLAELVRVLTPGRWLMTTNRVGWQARWILGRTPNKQEFISQLERAGLESVQVYTWQQDYDLAWAQKPFQTDARLDV